MAQIKQQLSKHKWLSIFGGTALVTLALITATGAMARPFLLGGHPSLEKMQKRILFMADDVLDDIDADDQQREEIDDIIQKTIAKLAPQMRAHAATRQAVLAELKKESPDRAQIEATLQAAAEKREATHAQMIDAVLEIHAVLNAEQRAALIERFKARRGHPGMGSMH